MSFEIIRVENVSGELIEYEIDRMEKFYWVATVLGALLVGIGMII